jgi:hypothetical protein
MNNENRNTPFRVFQIVKQEGILVTIAPERAEINAVSINRVNKLDYYSLGDKSIQKFDKKRIPYQNMSVSLNQILYLDINQYEFHLSALNHYHKMFRGLLMLIEENEY